MNYKMDNFLSSAYPVHVTLDEKQNAYITSENVGSAGFTKLELAALMIAQGMLANSPDWSEKETSINWVAENSVKYAKAILQAANL